MWNILPFTVFTLQFSNFDDDNNMFEKSGLYLAGPDRREMESIMLHLERENRWECILKQQYPIAEILFSAKFKCFYFEESFWTIF